MHHRSHMPFIAVPNFLCVRVLFRAPGRQDVPHVHIPVPQPVTPPEPAVITPKEGVPLQVLISLEPDPCLPGLQF
eukprot:SAG11_NODE_17694_length_511_cov_1.063107_1_plen_75_part_00